jgi:hypothetical protein
MLLSIDTADAPQVQAESGTTRLRLAAPPQAATEESRPALHSLDRAASSLHDCLRRAEGKVVDPSLVPGVFDLRLRVFEKQKDAPGCRQTAEMWERLDRKDADSLYSAACFRAVTAGVLRSSGQMPEAGKQAGAEVDKALNWLTRAVAAGYNTPRHLAQMTQDHDLDVLRNRADFRHLLAELLDRDFPGDPFAPENGVGVR